MSSMMESLSLLSSLHDEGKSENYIEPHYKEWYRVAIDALIEGGIDLYQDFLLKERVTEFLSDDELNYITNHIQKPPEIIDNSPGDICDDASSSGTYWPMESDVEAPNLDLGWPYMAPGNIGVTDINLYFNPPRGHPLTIKEIVRKMIKEARQVIAIVMDMFTDIDIFKELVEASTRGVPVYLLLDDINFPHFLKMAEKQGLQLQRLRNMRVRTVKGQDYFSKSGAKFCGKMEQKFILVDCEKVMYGSYSFMWSYEKVHLSMVQVITGKLVELFDEEFRTLYARSCIPAAFGPEESMIGKHKQIPWENGRYQSSVSSLRSASSQRSLFGRTDYYHTLDSTFLKSRSRFVNNEDDKYGMRNVSYRPHQQLGFNVQNKINQFQQFERNDNWKRHSYAAGDKAELSPYLLLNRDKNNRINNPPINWNRQVDVASIGSSSRGGYSSNINGSIQSFGNRLSQRQVPNLSEKHLSIRRSFHGTDNHIRFMQQRMPTLEHTTKSFLRNWRIESYLNDHSDNPPDSNEMYGDRYDVNEGTENNSDNSLYNHSRLRSSLLYKPTLPDQKEANSCGTNSSHSNSTIIDSQGSITPTSTLPQNRKFSEPKDQNSVTSNDTQHVSYQGDLKKHSLHVPESSRYSLNYSTNKGPSSYLYTNLCANKQTDNSKKQNENIFKRRSLPLFENLKVNVGQSTNTVQPNYIYSSLVRRQANISAHQNASNFNSTPNLEKTLHNVSVNSKSQESVVTQALSTESLDEINQEDHSKDELSKKESKSSPNFLKKGSKKLKSLLSLTPEKKESLCKNKTPAFYRMCSSSDTLVSEGDEHQNPKKSDTANDTSPRREKLSLSISQISLNKSKENVFISPLQSPKLVSNEFNPTAAQSAVDNTFLENTGDASAPRFNTEQIQYQESKAYAKNATYGRVITPAFQQRELSVRPQRETFQREQLHTEMPPLLQREMHLRHSQHREMQQKELQHRNFQAHPMPEYPIPQEDSNQSRVNERRVYSRFEPSMNVHNTNAQVSDIQSKSIGNNYIRPNNVLSYNSRVYNSVLPNENRFGRFMQKFGNFLHKKQ